MANCAPAWLRDKKPLPRYGGFFNLDQKQKEADDIGAQLQKSADWSEQTAALRRRQAALQKEVSTAAALDKSLNDLADLLKMAADENAADWLPEIKTEADEVCARVEEFNIRRFYSGEHDGGDAFLTVQAGSGGTEAQDWAAMLYRMYWQYAEKNDLSARLMEEMPGEVAGIKSATLKICGEYAYGNLRLETGIHRLVRKSPFDSNRRRHTSFASVFVCPLLEDNINIQIDPADLRTDTYRASGAGGQHVNTTDSAVRITHVPTGVVVQCQNDRSQHKNRAEAMRMLRARLYHLEEERRNAEKNKLEQSKDEIAWGRQIRSYVLDQSRIKDLRSGHESGNPRAVLDGDLAGFLRANLLSSANAPAGLGAPCCDKTLSASPAPFWQFCCGAATLSRRVF